MQSWVAKKEDYNCSFPFTILCPDWEVVREKYVYIGYDMGCNGLWQELKCNRCGKHIDPFDGTEKEGMSIQKLAYENRE